ncbi:von Willebrand factor C domain-containing protein 2-like [Bulinus truncatus]|nr:von Willebrand factor C domain-containing protein 2-like [Bulinus truncatus]
MNKMLLACVIIQICCCVTEVISAVYVTPSSALRPVTRKPRRCIFNGKSYKVGEKFRPNDCTFCTCETNGEPICAIIDCARPPCTDPVKLKGQCCLVCRDNTIDNITTI